jgi:hypothetical protein
MANKSLEMVVGAVAAGFSDRHSVVDIKPQKKLKTLGIQGKQVDHFKKGLYRALSPEGAKEFVDFDQLEISPSSTIRQVVSALPKTYQKKLSFGRGNQQNANVRAAVRTAVAQASKKHSVFEVTAEKKLGDLGFRGPKIPEIRGRLYKTLFPTVKYLPDLKDYLTGPDITASTTIKEISDKSLDILKELPGRRRRIPLTDRNASLPGSEGKRRKGGFPPPEDAAEIRRRSNLAGDEPTMRKGGFTKPGSKGTSRPR